MTSDSPDHKLILERLDRKRKTLNIITVVFAIVSLAFLNLLVLEVIPMTPLTFSILVGFVVGLLGIIHSYKTIGRQAKNILVPYSVSNLPDITDIHYLVGTDRNTDSMKKIQDIFKTHNIRRRLQEIDDYLQFQYKHCLVELLDGSLTYTRGSGKNSRNETNHYLILRTVFPDTVEGTTAVSSAPPRDNSWMFQLPESISTESLELNKIFQIRATNQVSARMHLQPNIMANILDLYKHHHYQNIVYYFDDSSLTVIMKENAGSFEPNMIESLLSPSQLSGILRDTERCLHIFDTMWLDLRARKE